METSDTSPEAAEVQFSIYRRMTDLQRLQIAIACARSLSRVFGASTRTGPTGS
jgi:hypothetical protein